jgi:hypothetical protein
LLLLASCGKREERPLAADFESLMGKDLPEWQYVQTQEDRDNLAFFGARFNEYRVLLDHPPERTLIPRVLHFIWIGPKPFPRESVENIRSWIAKNPDWTVLFWTDRERPLPHPAMQLRLLKDFSWRRLEECFHKSDNYGEQSDLWRSEILYREGGVYADHDVKCIRSFDSLNRAFDFYCGLEVPYKTALSSSVMPTNNLLGSRPGHPVLRYYMDWLVEHWDQIERDYPGKDRDAVINRVSHRTFSALGIALKAVSNQEGNRDMVFPAYYFNAPKDEWALFARHLYAGSWFENESAFEKMTRERLMYLSKKANRTLLWVGVLAACNLIGFGGLFLALRRR